MKINVEFLGLLTVSESIGKKKLEVNIPGGTVKAVIEELIRRYGNTVRDAFYDQSGNVDVMIQIALNGKSLISSDRHNTLLKEGDSLIFMMLVPGG